MKRLSYLFLLGILLCSCQNNLTAPDYHDAFDIKCYETNVTYSMMVYYPHSVLPSYAVPVVILLDGWWYGDMMEKEIHRLAADGTIPPCMLVSLNYRDENGDTYRQKDYMYPYPDSSSTYYEGGKQGDKLYRFITTDLFDTLAHRYLVDTNQRYILGHSLGGLFVLYSTLDNAEHPFFAGVVGASASVGQYNNYLFDKEQSIYAAYQRGELTDPLRMKIYLGCGNLVGNAAATHEAFFNNLSSRDYPGLQAHFDIFNATHTTDAYYAFRNGLIYLLND